MRNRMYEFQYKLLVIISCLVSNFLLKPLHGLEHAKQSVRRIIMTRATKVKPKLSVA